MAKRSKPGQEYVIRGLRHKHLEWSETTPGFIVLPAALTLRRLPDGRLEEGLSVFHPSVDQDALMRNKRLGFKALAKIDRSALESRGYRIVTKPHDPTAAEVVGLPLHGDPRARWVASDLLSALEIIRPPTPEELAALRREWEGTD